MLSFAVQCLVKIALAKNYVPFFFVLFIRWFNKRGAGLDFGSEKSVATKRLFPNSPGGNIYATVRGQGVIFFYKKRKIILPVYLYYDYFFFWFLCCKEDFNWSFRNNIKQNKHT